MAASHSRREIEERQIMRTVAAIRHVHFEHLGSFERVLQDRGYVVRYLEAVDGDLPRRVADLEPALLVVLGGPIGVYETEQYPFLREEIELLQHRLAQNQPTLGICLGAQLIAAALGARVYPGPQKEIGWSGLELSDAGKDSPLSGLAQDSVQVLHWHGDTFDLPSGATHLASTPLCRNQAFSCGKEILGLQFHGEVLGSGIESWLVGHASEIANTHGVTVNDLRGDTQRQAGKLEVQARRFFDAWLDQAGL
jgi:GMP synthase (glutamine-hydrolysing)